MQGGRFKNPVTAEGKVVVITGANTGRFLLEVRWVFQV